MTFPAVREDRRQRQRCGAALQVPEEGEARASRLRGDQVELHQVPRRSRRQRRRALRAQRRAGEPLPATSSSSCSVSPGRASRQRCAAGALALRPCLRPAQADPSKVLHVAFPVAETGFDPQACGRRLFGLHQHARSSTRSTGTTISRARTGSIPIPRRRSRRSPPTASPGRSGSSRASISPTILHSRERSASSSRPTTSTRGSGSSTPRCARRTLQMFDQIVRRRRRGGREGEGDRQVRLRRAARRTARDRPLHARAQARRIRPTTFCRTSRPRRRRRSRAK